jgi:hypothetical protein
MNQFPHKPLSIQFSEIFAAQGAPPVLLTPVANEKKTPAVPVAKFAAGVVDTGGKFDTGVVDTGGKFAAGVIDDGGKFATGVVETGGL